MCHLTQAVDGSELGGLRKVVEAADDDANAGQAKLGEVCG
jgi:hypothetical protein